MSSNLCLHSGGQNVTLEDVLAVTTPPSTETHYPIPHEYLIDNVVENLEGIGWTVKESQWGLNKDGEEMWGVMDLVNGGTTFEDYGVAIGLRNAHNKRFSAGVAVGSRVFVCDNLAFSSEIVVFRKHTKWIRKDLSRMLFEALGTLAAATKSQDERIQGYKRTPLTDAIVHDLLIRSVDAKVMANADIAKVLKQWREPEHQEFEDRNAWSLMNAFTQVGKGWNQFSLTGRTTRLHGLLDMVVEATENRMVVDDLVAGRAILPPAPIAHGAEAIISGNGEVELTA
jgi:hypothetical protein